MGKEDELWDDSALINAFDSAMTKYKKMHSKKSQDNATDKGKVTCNAEENIAADSDERQGDIREAVENSNLISNTTVEMGETENSAPAADGMDSFTGLPMQATDDYSYLQGAEDYNQLLGQYYELEDKRQRILGQLHQLGGYPYQFPAEGFGSGLQWGNCSTSQGHLVPESQGPRSTVVDPCCPYACPCSIAPCTSSACPLVGICAGKTCDSSKAMGPGEPFPHADDGIVKTAIGAAERAISSMKLKTSVNPEKENVKDSEGEVVQSTSSETDLSVVLNAWYSAGFYTGKYLTEQSIAKKWHG